jgi:predicted SAM-dependent methyltransferase
MVMKLTSLLPASVKEHLRPYWRLWMRSVSASLQLRQWLELHTKILAVKLKRIFIAAPIPTEAEGRLNLHLGCGKIEHEKFINIDGYPFPHVHYVQTIDKLPRFENCSVDLIYASHCLEHFPYMQTSAVLQEWCRVLKMGATLRLSVPDFDKLVGIYQLHNHDPDVVLEQLMGGQNNKYNYHLTVLNRVNLTSLLQAAGFSTVREWQPASDDLTTFDDFSVYKKTIAGKSYEISLNIEAIK